MEEVCMQLYLFGIKKEKKKKKYVHIYIFAYHVQVSYELQASKWKVSFNLNPINNDNERELFADNSSPRISITFPLPCIEYFTQSRGHTTPWYEGVPRYGGILPRPQLSLVDGAPV